MTVRTQIIVAVVAMFISSAAQAQYNSRAQTWEFGAQLLNSSSMTSSGVEGSSLRVSSDTGWGIGVNYNFSNRLSVGFGFDWLTPSYEATYIPEIGLQPITLRHKLDATTWSGKGTFYFVEGAISPYIEAGIGYTNIDSNVADGPPVTGCWWDPWWGYICSNFYSTYSDTRFSYSGTLGVRWDINREYGLKVGYGLMTIDTKSQTEDPEFDMWRAELYWRF